MYDLSIEREFCAAHALVIGGVKEAVHGHNWRVTVVVEGDRLDEDGLLCDFHALERDLDATLLPFQNVDLNQTPPFVDLNPTAEQVARHIAVRMAEMLSIADDTTARSSVDIRLRSVSVTEAPGCRATYRMNHP